LVDRSPLGDSEEWSDNEDINLNYPFEETEEWEVKEAENFDVTLFSAHTFLLCFILEADLSISSVSKCFYR
jgi:hypothetical protein